MITGAISCLIHFLEELQSSNGTGVGLFDGIFFGVLVEFLEYVGTCSFAIEGSIGIIGVLRFADDGVGAVVVVMVELGVGVGGEEGGGCLHYN